MIAGHMRMYTPFTLVASFKGPTWGPSWADRTQVGPMLGPWTLPSVQLMSTIWCRDIILGCFALYTSYRGTCFEGLSDMTQNHQIRGQSNQSLSTRQFVCVSSDIVSHNMFVSDLFPSSKFIGGERIIAFAFADGPFAFCMVVICWIRRDCLKYFGYGVRKVMWTYFWAWYDKGLWPFLYPMYVFVPQYTNKMNNEDNNNISADNNNDTRNDNNDDTTTTTNIMTMITIMIMINVRIENFQAIKKGKAMIIILQ